MEVFFGNAVLQKFRVQYVGLQGLTLGQHSPFHIDSRPLGYTRGQFIENEQQFNATNFLSQICWHF